MQSIPTTTKSRLTILVIAIIILSGTQIRSQPVTIDLIKGCETKGSIKLSDLAEKINCVKLETTKDCLIGGHTNSLFFFRDNWFTRQGGLLRFDQDGKFLNKISGRGKGPAEYIELSGVGFNAENNHVYLINCLTGKAIEFTLEGKFIGDVKNASSKSILFNNQYFVNTFPIRAQFKSDGYRITVSSLDGKIQKRYQKQDLSKVNQYLSIQNSVLYLYKDSVTCWEGVSDTVYRMGRDLKMTPRYLLNLGKETTPLHVKMPNSSPEWGKECDKYSAVIYFWETELFLYFAINRKGVPYEVFYNKSNGACFKIDRMMDDIEGGFKSQPYGVLDDGRLFYIISPSDLKDRYGGSPTISLTTALANQSLRGIVENSKDDDNPILILLTPKK